MRWSSDEWSRWRVCPPTLSSAVSHEPVCQPGDDDAAGDAVGVAVAAVAVGVVGGVDGGADAQDDEDGHGHQRQAAADGNQDGQHGRHWDSVSTKVRSTQLFNGLKI